MAVKLLLDFSSTCNSREKNITDCRVELVLSRSNPRQWCRDILWPIIVLSGVLKGSDWVTYTGSRGLRGWEQLNGISKSLSDAHWWDHSTPVLSPIYVRKQMEKKKGTNEKKLNTVSILSRFVFKCCIYPANNVRQNSSFYTHINVEPDRSIREEEFGWRPGIPNLPAQIRWTLFKP